MKYIFKSRETGKYIFFNGGLSETNDISHAYYVISDEDTDYVEMMVSINSIYPFYYETCLYEKELVMIRKNKLKNLNYFL